MYESKPIKNEVMTQPGRRRLDTKTNLNSEL